MVQRRTRPSKRQRGKEREHGGRAKSPVAFSRLSRACFSLDIVIKFAYSVDVTASELRRKLAKLGCTFEQGTRHLVVIYKGKATEMPRHPAKELKTGTVRGILKRLGIEDL
jgi:mRNA interferase HicA